MRVSAIVATCALVLAVASQATAAQSSKTAKASHGSIAGKLESYDASSRTMKVRAGKAEQEFKLTSNAVVHMGAKTLTADDLSSHQGQNIKVRYTVTDKDKMADSITIADTPHHGGKSDSHK
jgi:hypothetical protein